VLSLSLSFSRSLSFPFSPLSILSPSSSEKPSLASVRLFLNSIILSRATSHQARSINSKHQMASENTNLLERLVILILQIVGFVGAILFGVFGILSWKASMKAVDQANSANLLAFLALCSQSSNDASTPYWSIGFTRSLPQTPVFRRQHLFPSYSAC
jgi:hypothetical protein